jgi:hypothetical protein
MRAVLNVGGYCAEGGAYVIAQHCPDGAALLIPLAVFAGLGSAGLVGWKGAVLGGPWAGLVLLAWPGLFISLGWNFLEFAFFPPDSSGIELGWLIPGVIFVIMGAAPLLGFLPGSSASRALGSAAFSPRASGRDRYLDQLHGARATLLADLVERAEEQARASRIGYASAAGPDYGGGMVADYGGVDAGYGGSGSVTGASGAALGATSEPDLDADLVSKLERLDALHRSGALSYIEFQRAKDALLQGLAN